MNFLNAGGTLGRNIDGDVGDGGGALEARPDERNRRQPLPFGFGERREHVSGAPAGGDGKRDIARAAERLDLARKHLVVLEVVGDAGDDARVGRQRQGGDRRRSA